jgi:hypothetical protein
MGASPSPSSRAKNYPKRGPSEPSAQNLALELELGDAPVQGLTSSLLDHGSEPHFIRHLYEEVPLVKWNFAGGSYRLDTTGRPVGRSLSVGRSGCERKLGVFIAVDRRVAMGRRVTYRLQSVVATVPPDPRFLRSDNTSK